MPTCRAALVLLLAAFAAVPDAQACRHGHRARLTAMAPAVVQLPATAYAQPFVRSYAAQTRDYNSGCGSRGGPGWRKANGQCASWRD